MYICMYVRYSYVARERPAMLFAALLCFILCFALLSFVDLHTYRIQHIV